MSNTSSDVKGGPSAASADVNGAASLKTLQAPNGAGKPQKRKRDSEAALISTETEASTLTSVFASPSKGKGRAVSFAEDVSTQQHEGSPPASGEGVSQQDAFKASKVNAENAEKSKAKKKTTAKARYLKAKMARYKAKKRVDKNGRSEAGSSDGDRDTDMNDTMMTEDGDISLADTSVAVNAAEEKRAIKKAKREERRAKEALEAETSANNVTVSSSPDDTMDLSLTAGPSKSDILEDADKRKAERKAKKAAKRAVLESAEGNGEGDGEVSMPDVGQVGDDQVLLKRDLALIARAEELKVRQEKANKRAKAKQKYGKGDREDEEKENDIVDIVPTQPDALPRFPKPVQPVAPSQRELDDLLISHDLRHAVLVDQSTIVPVTELQEQSPQCKLSQQTLDRLREMNIENFFAVQSAVLPVLLENKKLYTTRQRPKDICVSAPTGSGKTLSYVIPVVETLRTRVVTRLRALVVLPTRELVIQVRDVFEQFCKGTGLKVAAATGQHSFSGEQIAIADEHDRELQGGSSKVDILVVTPGRLMDHLKSTRNFTLQHLRFLVIDEADRLLSQNFNDWLKVLISHIENREGGTDFPKSSTTEEGEARKLDPDGAIETDSLAPQLVDSRFSLLDASATQTHTSSAQKLLFSATLTRDPTRIAALNLHKPVYIAVVNKPSGGEDDPDLTASTLLESDRNFALPESLTEKMIVTRTSDKALTFLYLLYTTKLRNTLCFTKSVESAARLVMLVDAFNTEYAKEDRSGTFEPLKIAHYSSELGPGQRKEVMDSFKKGDIQILVCSDIAARGLDIPTLENVVNYDVPVAMRNYVHRVGRTARAGRSGTAWSLVEVQEAKYFKTLLSEAGRLPKVKNLKIKRDDVSIYKDAFESALTHLQV